MSLSKTNIAALQKAGQTLYAAAQGIEQAVRTQAESLTAVMASSPFAAEAEQVLAQFRKLARLSQDLAAVEQRMREIFGVAQELARPESDVVIPQVAHSRIEHSKEAISDVEAKPARTGRAVRGTKMKATPKGRKSKATATESATTAATKTRALKRKGRYASELTPNDQKLVQYLESALGTDSWTHMPAPKMAAGAQLPLGSIGISLKKLLNLGRIKRGTERGTYQRT